MCASAVLSNGVTLTVIATRQAGLVEPYVVHLERATLRGDRRRFLLGDEDSFWWFTSLDVISKESVKVRSFGQTVVVYNVTNDSVRRVDILPQ